jgi:hypothetical protein
VVDAVRPVREAARDTDVLQQWSKDHDCHGVDAVIVTRSLLGCTLREAQQAFLGAPCRRAEREFQEGFLDALEGAGREL